MLPRSCRKSAFMELRGPDHIDTLDIQNSLPGTLVYLGQLPRAKELQEEVLAAMTQLLGTGHPYTLNPGAASPSLYGSAESCSAPMTCWWRLRRA